MSQSGWDLKRPEPAKKVHVVKIDNMKRIKFVFTALPVPAWHELTQVVEDFFVIMGRNGNKNVMDFILQIFVFSFEFLNSVFFKKPSYVQMVEQSFIYRMRTPKNALGHFF